MIRKVWYHGHAGIIKISQILERELARSVAPHEPTLHKLCTFF